MNFVEQDQKEDSMKQGKKTSKQEAWGLNIEFGIKNYFLETIKQIAITS